MTLTSEAIAAFDRDQLRRWDWRATTILLVAHDWDASAGGAEALAGRRLVRALLAAGAHVHVLAGAVGRAADIEHPHHSVTVAPCVGTPTSRIARAATMVRTMVPEVSGPWVASAAAVGQRLLASLPPDTVIYSRAMPGSSNIAGWHLARCTGRPWVAHFSDRWPAPQVLPASRKLLAPYKWPMFAAWRRRILRDAGALTFTNPAQAAEMTRRDPTYREKAFVVTHLASRTLPSRTPPQFESFHIVHTGNLYPPDHTAGALLRGLRLFLDAHPEARRVVRVTQAGWANGDVAAWRARCGLDGVVHMAGRLSEEGVLELTESASLLVAIDYCRPNSTTLLSKLPDYINARRPILAIANPMSTLGRICLDDGAGMTAAPDAPEQVAERIAEVYEAWRRRRLDPLLPRPGATAAFAPQNVLTELAGALTRARRAQPCRGEYVTVAGETRRPAISTGAEAQV